MLESKRELGCAEQRVGYPTEPVGADKPTLETALMHMEKSIVMLRENIDELESILVCVSHPDHPKPSAVSQTVPPESFVDIAQNFVLHIAVQSERVRDIRERLRLR